MALLHALTQKYDIQSFVESFRVDADEEMSCTMKEEEKFMFEKRNFAQFLHKFQEVPGYLDLLKLVFGIVCTLLGTDSLVCDNKVSILPLKLVATSRAVSIFLTWLER